MGYGMTMELRERIKIAAIKHLQFKEMTEAKDKKFGSAKKKEKVLEEKIDPEL